MICRSPLTDADFTIIDQCPDDIPDEAAELIAAAVMEMIEAGMGKSPSKKPGPLAGDEPGSQECI